MKRFLMWGTGLFIGLSSGLWGCSTLRHRLDTAPVDANAPARFEGLLLALSDADQNASAYGDGKLGRVAGLEDSLSLIRLVNGKPQISRVHVSNSVVSWPSIAAVVTDSAGRRLAYIVETKGRPADGVQQVKSPFFDLPDGKVLTTVDIGTPTRVLDRREMGGTYLGTVSVNHRRDLLVIPSKTKGRELLLVSLKNGLPAREWAFPGLPVAREGSDAGTNAIAFHPTDDVFAVNTDNNRVSFYRAVRLGDSLRVEPIGAPMPVGRSISVMNWLPDGSHLLVTDTNWKPGALGPILNDRGRLFSIRFDAGGSHQVVSEAEVGLSPEGFDISPDGRLAVTCNMRRTYLPGNLPIRRLVPAHDKSSLSLVTISPAGMLKTVGEWGFEGALPEDAVFDATGQAVAATIYNNLLEDFPRQGYIEFWNVTRTPAGEPTLVRTNLRMPVPRGVHNLLTVKP
ncbi:MAG: hypothetical protein EAZ91_08675 [Cytophagales bacterium]|nr:MAG: hypothetical protein EAZ91_08675 [Cytophagales bacterium]